MILNLELSQKKFAYKIKLFYVCGRESSCALAHTLQLKTYIESRKLK